MRFTIATWNINSVRLREVLVAKLLAETGPDVLCLQETKVTGRQDPNRKRSPNSAIPIIVARGEKGYNGVAIFSRAPLKDAGSIDFCTKGDARHVAAKHESGLTIHNLLCALGRRHARIPIANDKFDHKLRFVDEMATTGSHKAQKKASVLVGDSKHRPPRT